MLEIRFSRSEARGQGHSDPKIVRDHARIQEFSSGGVQVSLTKKSSDNVFFFFLVLSLLYRSQIDQFKEIYHFSWFQRRSNIFQGGPTFSRGGGGPIAYSL